MIELFVTPGTVQTEKHYTTIRTLIPVVDTAIEQDLDFSTCTVQCIPNLRMLTDEVGDDWYKNDYFTMYQNSIASGSHEIAIIVNDVEIAVTDDTYGKLYTGVNFTGYRFDAYSIWSEHGYGNYRTVMRTFDVSSSVVKEEWSACFKVELFSDKSANGTVVIESQKNGSLRNGKKYYDLSMPGAQRSLPYWSQRVRLPGKLKRSGLPIELSGVTMNDITQTRKQVFDTMGEAFDLHINLVSSEQILPVIFDDMFANVVMVTDYNVYNFEAHRRLRLLRESIEVQPRVVKRKSFVFKMISDEKKNEKFNDSL
jgi:hypothetical protein